MASKIQQGVNALGWILGGVGCLIALGSLLAPGAILLQGRPEHSIPFRVALQMHAPAAWHRGDFVQFATRDLAPYYPVHTLFVKQIAAVPGDRLRLEGRRIFVNNTALPPARTVDSQGRPAPLYIPAGDPATGACRIAASPTLPEHAECTMPPATLFVMGSHERSFDSRYWGLVQTSEVIGRVVPLL